MSEQDAAHRRDGRLRVLLVEDDPLDVDLIIGMLEREHAAAVTRVASEPQFIEQLTSGEFDIVISDYNLPGFSGEAALELMYEHGRDLPFVVVSGVLEIEDAVRMLHAGADDFVSKDQLARLGPAIARVLRMHSEQNARRRAEEMHRALTEAAPDAIVATDEAGRVVAWNRAAERIFGFDRDQIIGERIARLMPDRHRLGDEQVFASEDVAAGEPVRRMGRHRDGHEFPIELSIGEWREGGRRYLSAVVRDISDRVAAEAALRDGRARLERSLRSTIEALGNTLEKRDPYTAGHQRGVAALARAIGATLGLDEKTLLAIELGGVIHDIGKISVPAEILSRPGRLSDEEFALIRTHPLMGHDIIRNAGLPPAVVDIVLHHHERLDGSGYPHGLAGDSIPRETRVLAVADVVDAMSSHRPYRPALGFDAALAELGRTRGTLFDPEAVEACETVVVEGRFRGADSVYPD